MADFRKITAPGAEALAELGRLREAFSATGLWPILFGEPAELDKIFYTFVEYDAGGRRVETKTRYDSGRVAPTLAAAAAIDPAGWFEERARQAAEDAAGDDDEDDDSSPDVVTWPISPQPGVGIITHREVLTQKLFPEVVIGLFPVAAPWEVFAHLNYGSWNGCPAAAEHCAIHRSRAEQYGAEVVSVTGDVVQCTVARPPGTRDASRALAREQSLYCGDIVDQGSGSVEALAADLWQAPTWYFWWD